MKTLRTLLSFALLALCTGAALAAPPVIVSPVSPVVVTMEEGAVGYTLTATCTSETAPTAHLLVDHGWFKSESAFLLPVTQNGDGTYSASVFIFAPTVLGYLGLPQLEAPARFIVFRTGGESATSAAVKVLTVARGTQVFSVLAP